MEHRRQVRKHDGLLYFLGRHATLLTLLLLAACGTGGDSGQAPNTPLTTPMALVVNQDDTTLTTLRLDGKNSPVISTLSLGPVQPDAIGGVTFSLGEWVFVTNTSTNKVAAIDPIGGPKPILEVFLEVNGPVRLGQRPSRIYRDPVDKEVLWIMNEGDPTTGADTHRPCSGGSVSVVHNSHLSAGGLKPHVVTTSCLFGVGEHLIAFSRPPAVSQEVGFISSKTTGIVETVLADRSFGHVRYSPFIAKIDLCDNIKESSMGYPVCDSDPTTLNHSEPAGMFWSQATGKIYCYLAGYQRIVEIEPDFTSPNAFKITNTIDIIPPANAAVPYVSMTPDGRFLFLAGEDVLSDASKVIGKIGVVDLTVANPTLTMLSIPQLDNIRPRQFKFTPDGRRLYVTQSNKINDLAFAAQAHNLKLDKLLVFDPSTFPAAPTLVAEIDVPPVGSNGLHGMDLWIAGPHGAGTAKGVVVTNATPGVNGSVSLINAAGHTITGTIPVGKNPKQVTVYYVGLAASDNQATPIW